jgi:mRNA interferase MazF
MRRGEIRIIDLDPTVGQEANKRRPAIIVSNDGANNAASRLGRGVLTVVPLTSNTERVYPFQVLLPAATTGLSINSKAQAEQVRAVSVSRIGEAVGFVDGELMQQVEDALRLHLGL